MLKQSRILLVARYDLSCDVTAELLDSDPHGGPIELFLGLASAPRLV